MYHLEDVVEETEYQLESDSRYALRYESLAQEEKATVSVTSKGGDSKQVQVPKKFFFIKLVMKSGYEIPFFYVFLMYLLCWRWFV